MIFLNVERRFVKVLCSECQSSSFLGINVRVPRFDSSWWCSPLLPFYFAPFESKTSIKCYIFHLQDNNVTGEICSLCSADMTSKWKWFLLADWWQRGQWFSVRKSHRFFSHGCHIRFRLRNCGCLSVRRFLTCSTTFVVRKSYRYRLIYRSLSLTILQIEETLFFYPCTV